MAYGVPSHSQFKAACSFTKSESPSCITQTQSQHKVVTNVTFIDKVITNVTFIAVGAGTWAAPVLFI